MNSDNGPIEEPLLVPPTVPLIELEDGDQWHEIWKTAWTEYLMPQLGKNWRMFLAGVLRGDGEIEWIYFREYENLVREVVVHMRCQKDQWNIVLEIAHTLLEDLSKGINKIALENNSMANPVDLDFHKCEVEEKTTRVVGIRFDPGSN